MPKDDAGKAQNKITLEGVTYKTNGNIVFEKDEDAPYHLAQSSLLEQMDDLLENGMLSFVKKIKN